MNLHPRRKSTAMVLFLFLPLAAGLAGACAGGSGSSGFSRLTENRVIRTVIEQGACDEHDGLVICPAEADGEPMAPDTATATATPTATPSALPTTPIDFETPGPASSRTPSPTVTPTRERSPTPTPTAVRSPDETPPGGVLIESPAEDALCTIAGPFDCAFAFTFVPLGLPPENVYAVAFREAVNAGEEGTWLLASIPQVSGPASMPEFQVLVPLDLLGLPPGESAFIQIAILTFTGDPGELSGEFMTLGELGADAAFVTAPVEVLTP